MKLKHIILLCLVFMIFFLSYLSYKSVFISNNVKQKRTNFLLLGVDFVDNAVHSDTVILLSYDHKTKLLDIISIPRDSYVDIPELKYKKIAEVYAYFYKKTKDKLYSAKMLKEVLESKIFSYENKKISIPYYVVIDYDRFKKMIDTIGKIKIFVTEPMHYDDYAGNLHIHFDCGTYYMSGEEVLKYVRYRDIKGDIGRINRQQQLIKSVLEKILSPGNWIKLPNIIANFKNFFITNINYWEIVNMILEFKNLRFTNFRFSLLSGKPTGRYLFLDNEEMISLINYLTRDSDYYQDVKETKRVLIKVYNASKNPKIAKQVAMLLREKGYDVLDWANWYSRLQKSKIINYGYNINIINDLCNFLNIYEISTIYSPKFNSEDKSLKTDIIIILGEDFQISKLSL